jgi:hypothetical protein
LEHLADGHILYDWQPKRLFNMDLIVIGPSDTLFREIAIRFKIDKNAMNESFGNAQHLGHSPGRNPAVPSDEKKHGTVMSQKCPRGHEGATLLLTATLAVSTITEYFLASFIADRK